MVSAQPGLVPRLEGKHTRDRIMATTIYFDHYSGYIYSHLQCSTDTEDTVLSKHAFESLCQTNNVHVSSFRADNGRFAERAFKDAVRSCNQTITYCGVGAHHQNGLFERYIGELTSVSRTLLFILKEDGQKLLVQSYGLFLLKQLNLSIIILN